MKRAPVILALTAAIIFSLFWFWPGFAAASDEWPMYQANAAHTGFVPVSLDPGKFAQRWVKPLSGAALNPVTVAGGRVFVSANSSDLNANGPNFFALDSTSGDILWTKSLDDIYSVNPPSYSNGTVYILTGQGETGNVPPYLNAYGAATGNLVFSSRFTDQWGNYYAPTIYEGKVYIGGGGGGMYRFDGITGYQDWVDSSLPVNGIWTPAVDANYAYAYLGAEYSYTAGLYAIDRATGQQVFQIPDPNYSDDGNMEPAPVLGAMSDVFVIDRSRLIRFDINTRSIGWVDSADFSGQPAVANGIVYAINAGALGAYDEKTGATLWMWEPPESDSLQGTIIATNTDIFVGSAGNTYCVDLAGHSQVWRCPAGGYLSLGEGSLYIAGANGVLTAISLGLPDIYAPQSVAFAPPASGQTTTVAVPIMNAGNEPLLVQTIASSSAEFTVQMPALPLTLAPGKSISLQVSYAPAAGGTGTGNLSITSNDPDESPISVALTRSFSITATAGAGGQVSPSGTTTVAPGHSLSLTMTPDSGYQLTALLVDGVNVSGPSSAQQSYTLEDVTSDHTLKAVFTPYVDYFGMQAGDHFEFQTTDASGNSQTETDDISSSLEDDSLIDTAVLGNTTTQTWYQEGDDGLVVTQLQDSGKTASFAPGLPMVETPLAAGKSWSASSSVYINGVTGTAAITATVSAMRLVSVPAGRFMAWPITYTLTITATKTAKTTSTVLFAPYVGTIDSSDSGSTQVLTAFKVGGGTLTTPPPVLTGVSPASGAAGTQVTINGYQFGATRGAGLVMIGNLLCDQITSWSDTQIGFTVPQDASSGPVVVLTDNWAGINSISFLTGLWQNGANLGNGWEDLSWFGAFNTNGSPWIYHQDLGWLYPFGTSTESIWFWDPQWNGQGGWWWTSASVFPWVYCSSDKAWYYYDQKDSTPGVRLFCNSSSGCRNR